MKKHTNPGREVFYWIVIRLFLPVPLSFLYYFILGVDNIAHIDSLILTGILLRKFHLYIKTKFGKVGFFSWMGIIISFIPFVDLVILLILKLRKPKAVQDIVENKIKTNESTSKSNRGLIVFFGISALAILFYGIIILPNQKENELRIEAELLAPQANEQLVQEVKRTSTYLFDLCVRDRVATRYTYNLSQEAKVTYCATKYGN